jgi:hypothetical protein
VYGTFENTKRRRRVHVPTVPDALRFAREQLKIEPDEQQQKMLLAKTRRGMLNCSRQFGKSTIAAIKALHKICTEPDRLVLVASPTERQSREFLRKAKRLLRRAGMKWKRDGDNRVSILMPNGSRIVGIPGTEATVRGFSAVSLMLIDEAAHVSDGLYRALRPMLADGKGELWLMSTPWGKRGFFYENWMHGGEAWTKIRVPATECPRISREFLEEERVELGELHVRQEYMCEFIGNAMGLFDPDAIAGAVDEDVERLHVVSCWE